MSRYLKLLCLQFILWLGLPLYAQQTTIDSTQTLKEVKVNAARLENFSAGTKIQKIDSGTLLQYQAGNLSDLLEGETPVFVKSYGQGSLATTSFRGGSAEQTAILWNGFNINNPMYGLSDLSLIPNSFIDNVAIQYGGVSTLWGSGAMGGAILLNNNEQFDEGITASAGISYGSFAQFKQNLSFTISKAKWVSSIRLFNASSKNDFDYYNTQLPKSPLQQQTNAALWQYGLLSDNSFRIDNTQTVKLCFWYQNGDREIPPSMVESVSDASQKDWCYRLTAAWEKTSNKVTYQARVGYFNENLLYVDSIDNLRSFSNSQTLIGEAESKIRLTQNQLVNVGINNTYAVGKTDSSYNGFKGMPHRDDFAIFASYSLRNTKNNLHSTLSLRQEFVNGTTVPFTYSLGADWAIFKWLSLKGNAGRVYRLPDFDELYWNPGGNPNLLPENGYSEEAGLLEQVHFADSHIGFTSEQTLFNKNISDWIQWLPGPVFWSPDNIMKVWSRGLETKSELSFKFNKLVVKLGLITNYVLSTNQEAAYENDASVGMQLIYVPRYTGTGKLTIEYRKFTLAFNQSYTGYRFTSTDNTEYLMPYWLSNIYASYRVDIKACSISVFVRVNNLTGEQYQVIQNQAMPLSNYMAGINVQFKSSNKNNQNK